MIRTSVTRLLPLGLGLALVLPSSGCILPAHHRAATVVNATIGGFGLIGIVGPSFGDSSGVGLDLTPVIREAGASLLVLALVGEALTMFVTPDPDDDAVTPAGGSGSGVGAIGVGSASVGSATTGSATTGSAGSATM
jgi:hypothetical protein